jgi:hypothetical protein
MNEEDAKFAAFMIVFCLFLAAVAAVAMWWLR